MFDAAKWGMPPEIARFVDNGALVVTKENDVEWTLTLDIPSLGTYDRLRKRDTWVTLYWIHPDHNAEFCPYYDSPGDGPNFWVDEFTEDVGGETLDVGENTDDLAAWLASLE